ncbi:MAG: hypothetical protein ACNS62_18015 [Candidatus Cyclobacteriaceae bacterium M3_2C_046]
MYYCRVYSDEQGETHFQEVEIQLEDQGLIGHLSRKYPVSTIQFRENSADYDWDFHIWPRPVSLLFCWMEPLRSPLVWEKSELSGPEIYC